MKETSKVLNLPPNLVPLCTVVIGYPDKDNTPKDKWNEQNVSYGAFK